MRRNAAAAAASAVVLVVAVAAAAAAARETAMIVGSAARARARMLVRCHIFVRVDACARARDASLAPLCNIRARASICLIVKRHFHVSQFDARIRASERHARAGERLREVKK